jgi:hypothetical protein
MGVLAVAIMTGWSTIVLLDLVLFLINTGETAFEPAAQSMVPAVVPRDQLERANGWLVGGLTLSRFMIHAALWTIVGSSLRQRLTPEHMLGRVTSANLFISAGGEVVGALLGGALAEA